VTEPVWFHEPITVSTTEVSLLLDPVYGMLYLQNYDTTSALDFSGANWSRVCLSMALNNGALWHIVFLPLRNILTYFLTYLLTYCAIMGRTCACSVWQNLFFYMREACIALMWSFYENWKFWMDFTSNWCGRAELYHHFQMKICLTCRPESCHKHRSTGNRFCVCCLRCKPITGCKLREYVGAYLPKTVDNVSHSSHYRC